ncbi:hypothetical protein [Mesorhizobium delmotii]|uniref:hypothetical protein n=1 Tax=Mesorhizobium delmotii TaxID=1631247 RepID=UPI001FCE8CE1
MSGIVYVIRNGLQWKDAPTGSRTGVFDRIFAALAGEGPEPERIMIDATHTQRQDERSSFAIADGVQLGVQPAFGGPIRWGTSPFKKARRGAVAFRAGAVMPSDICWRQHDMAIRVTENLHLPHASARKILKNYLYVFLNIKTMCIACILT